MYDLDAIACTGPADRGAYASPAADITVSRILEWPIIGTSESAKTIEPAARIALAGSTPPLDDVLADHLALWCDVHRVEPTLLADPAVPLLIATTAETIGDAHRIASAQSGLSIVACLGRIDDPAILSAFDIVLMSEGTEALKLGLRLLMPIRSLICFDMADVRQVTEQRIVDVKALPRSAVPAAFRDTRPDSRTTGFMFWAPDSELLEIDGWVHLLPATYEGRTLDCFFGCDPAWSADENILFATVRD